MLKTPILSECEEDNMDKEMFGWICKQSKFSGAQDIINDIDFYLDEDGDDEEDTFTYKGKAVEMIEEELLGKGAFGEVYKITVKDEKGNQYSFAKKIPGEMGQLSEVKLEKKFADGVSCPDKFDF